LRHVIFWTFVVIAMLPAAALAFPFAMNECQLNNTQAAIDTCFARNAWGFRIYAASFLGFVALSVTLYARQNRWALPSIVLVATGPFILVLACAALSGS
jgi:hypothetical protein